MTQELVSNCCDATMQGEPSNNWLTPEHIEGRCSDCKEMAVFNSEDEERV